MINISTLRPLVSLSNSGRWTVNFFFFSIMSWLFLRRTKLAVRIVIIESHKTLNCCLSPKKKNGEQWGYIWGRNFVSFPPEERSSGNGWFHCKSCSNSRNKSKCWAFICGDGLVDLVAKHINFVNLIFMHKYIIKCPPWMPQFFTTDRLGKMCVTLWRRTKC